MFWKRSIVLVIFIYEVHGRYRDGSTTKTYDIQVPGSSPIKIIEDESYWDNKDEDTTTVQYKLENRKIPGNEDNIRKNMNSLRNPQKDYEEKITEDPSQALKNFLHNYSEKIRKKAHQDNGEKNLQAVPLIMRNDEEPSNRLANLYLDEKNNHQFHAKPKGWDLLHLERHNHPYDDRKGWVSLEAVPWSVSKISKWHSNQQNPEIESEIDRNYNKQKPWIQKPVKPNYDYRPSYQNEHRHPEVLYNRPSTHYNQKVHIQTEGYPSIKFIDKPFNYGHKHDENCNHEIITDGLLPNFPSNPSNNHHDYNRRRGSSHEFLPETHPLNGDGEWILLSTTKGYKRPKQRERSMQVENNESVSTHRSVRLTVLPPLKNSKVNMTTSHGGLLQVESTFQTVDQAQRAYVKKQKTKNKTSTRKPSRKVKPKYNLPTQIMSTVTKSPINISDTSAVLAAVGAGMIPATMAMLVPMAMSGKRRKRSTNERITSNLLKHVTSPTFLK